MLDSEEFGKLQLQLKEMHLALVEIQGNLRAVIDLVRKQGLRQDSPKLHYCEKNFMFHTINLMQSDLLNDLKTQTDTMALSLSRHRKLSDTYQTLSLTRHRASSDLDQASGRNT